MITQHGELWFIPSRQGCFNVGLLLFGRSVVSNSLWPHGLQHAKLPCLSLSPRVYWNSCPLSWWCYLTISFSAAFFSFCLQAFTMSGSFPMSWLFTLGGQSIGASASVLPVNVQDWFPLGWTGLISLWSKGLSLLSSPAPQFKSNNSSGPSLLYGPTLTSIHDYSLVKTDDEVPIFWPSDVKSQLIGKDPDAGKNWGWEEKEMTKDELTGEHHWLNGHEFEQTLGDSGGQRSLMGYSPWGHNKLHTT